MRNRLKLSFGFLLLAFVALRASAALAAPALVQTIDLGTWTGTLANFSMYPLPPTFTSDPRFL